MGALSGELSKKQGNVVRAAMLRHQSNVWIQLQVFLLHTDIEEVYVVMLQKHINNLNYTFLTKG